MISIPEDFTAAAVVRAGEAGRAWIERLPALVETLCEQWDLVIDGASMHGWLGLVTPVRRGDEPCMLKVSWIDDSNAHEAVALAAWGGHGAVRLLAARAEIGAMLLERLDSRRLDSLDIDEAVAIAGGLLRRLAVPAPVGVPRLTFVAEQLAETLPERWEQLGRAVPRRLIDTACDVAVELGPSAGDLLVNYDLHYENVLAGTREPWLAIDPKVVAGDPEYGMAQLLWTRLEDMGGGSGVHRYLQVLIDTAGLDPSRARSWTLVRCMDYWLWGLSIGLTEDPAKCAVIVDELASYV